MMYIVYLECNISDWYSANTLGRVESYWIMYKIQWWEPLSMGNQIFIWWNMKNVPYARHQLNTYCWSHELPRLHTIGQMVGTPTALLATPSAPPPHCQPTGHCSNIPCWPTGHHSIPTVDWLVNPPTPLSADWSSLQHTLSANWSPFHPHCRPTGHHSIPTVSRLVITPTYPVSWLVTTPSPLSAALLAHQPHCRPTHY